MKKIVLILLGFICFSLALAQSKTTFDVSKANASLDKLSIKLSTENINVRHMQDATTTLAKLYEQAQHCATAHESEIESINKQLNSIKESGKTITKPTSDQRYLEEKLNKLVKRQSECRLFALRAKEAIDAFNDTIQKLTTRKLLRLDSPVWQNIKQIPTLWQKTYSSYDPNILWNKSGFAHLSLINSIFFVFLLTIFLLGAYKIRTSIKKILLKKQTEADSNKPSLSKALYATLNYYSYPIAIFLTFSVFASVHKILHQEWTYLGLTSYLFLAYFIFLGVVRFAFNPPAPAQPFTRLAPKNARRFLRQLNWLAILTILGILSYLFLHQQAIPAGAITLLQTVFVTLFSVLLIYFIWTSCQSQVIFNQHPIAKIIIGISLTLGFIFIISAEWFGYHELTRFLLKGLVLMIIYTFLAWLLHAIFTACLSNLTEQHHPWQHRMRNLLGVKSHHALPEIIVWHIALNLIIIIGWLLLMLQTWGMSPITYNKLINSLTSGFEISGLHFNVLHIVFAISIFPIFTLTTRLLRRYLATHTMRMEHGAQIALSVIFGYLGFGISILLAMLIAGVNFTGLAIIAGALSVGIGFGLQNIVNNFLSGIILLLERPVKSGDRVIVGDVEGFVKKVRIRSTQIRTLQRSDVIVPNAELVSQQVTNLMFRDEYWRIAVKVGVAYGSDTHLVEKLLLQAAHENPNVVKEEKYLPLVLFTAFGENSLEFQLWCIIDDVNLKFKVESALNFRVDELFRKNNIVIAFPQRDVHIRDWHKENNASAS